MTSSTIRTPSSSKVSSVEFARMAASARIRSLKPRYRSSKAMLPFSPLAYMALVTGSTLLSSYSGSDVRLALSIMSQRCCAASSPPRYSSIAKNPSSVPCATIPSCPPANSYPELKPNTGTPFMAASSTASFTALLGMVTTMALGSLSGGTSMALRMSLTISSSRLSSYSPSYNAKSRLMPASRPAWIADERHLCQNFDEAEPCTTARTVWDGRSMHGSQP
mmetsp:Transcript_33485/g.61811  ORF Transcript_33485/g.61811 Transcript_33485/m.61811 type:complete len:221 (-) Transcript_33485:474-1136(-)